MIELNTTIHEPDLVDATEAEIARFSLSRARATFAWKVEGLDADALGRAFPPSAMTIGGLLKHLALVEDERTMNTFFGASMAGRWRWSDFEADPDFTWNSAKNDTPDELYELWRSAVERSDAALDAMLADGKGLDQPTGFTLDDGRAVNLRRALVDMSDEYARHLGHADLFREAIDGRVGEDPPQA